MWTACSIHSGVPQQADYAASTGHVKYQESRRESERRPWKSLGEIGAFDGVLATYDHLLSQRTSQPEFGACFAVVSTLLLLSAVFVFVRRERWPAAADVVTFAPAGQGHRCPSRFTEDRTCVART